MGRKENKARKEKKASAKPSAKTYTGTLDITRSGMGFVIVENMQKDILVRPSDLNRAFHGDKVRVKITRERGNRSEGEVLEVLERKQTEFIGTIEVNKDFAFFIADSAKKIPDFYIPTSGFNHAKDGDRVVVKMVGWGKDDKNPKGTVISVLNDKDTNDMAMKELLVENGFPLVFSDDAMEQALRQPDVIGEEEIKARKDMREILTFTIDPVDARDFDDAISFRKLKTGVYEIGVHIADVSHYLEEESVLDQEAYERATSVYLPDRVLPMLPERISNELCSLRPHEDKLTFSCIFQINQKGEVKNYWIGRTVIHSNHRFTYEDVQEIIDSGKGLYHDEILLLNGLAQQFRKQRFKSGAINFSSQEVRFKLDEDGKPIGIVVKESKESHQLIEEFMLLANRTVAENVSKYKVNKKVVPFPYRVHDQPDEEKLTPFVAFARKYGHHFDISSPRGIASSFNEMLVKAHGKPEQHVLEQLGIRTMAKAIYTTDNIGHYGLAFEHYCHFTSPIRRYPDILVHRIMAECLAGSPRVDKKLEEKCRHSSERERAAMEAERASNKYKQVEFMKQFLGEEFDAVISGVASFGFWAETIEHKCEGLVSVQSLLDYDDFRHVDTEYALVGRRSGRSFRMGDKVRVKLIAANQSKRQLDYEWVLNVDDVEESDGKERKSKKSKGKK
ncbi:MAG TPA: ribonuclease R [Chitinophagaceae bacterium]|nr:ribonuclease R [Chitinophagaceae bacterium]